MIIIAGTATANITDPAAALHHIRTMVQASEAEVGCHTYRIYADPEVANRFFIFEVWEDAAALQHHFQTPHMQVFNAFLQQVQASLEVKRYEVSSVTPL